LIFADERPANPVTPIFKATANDSPSPWGEGRDEGERKTFLNELEFTHAKIVGYRNHDLIAEPA
jgi:hypothetical protein